MTRNEINREYFNWLSGIVGVNRYSKRVSYRKLLVHLHNTDFRYSIPRDENRAYDGVDLRYRFACEYGVRAEAKRYLQGPCSVLEMMIALVLKCEETIMDDPSVGDRTGQWFWNMIVNLGLGSMHDDQYNEESVSKVLDRFMDREYEPDGRGGLFRIRNFEYDLRDVEIWRQMCFYLDSII